MKFWAVNERATIKLVPDRYRMAKTGNNEIKRQRNRRQRTTSQAFYLVTFNTSSNTFERISNQEFQNIDTMEEDDNDVSPPKQSKIDSFPSASTELKKSEFFKEEVPGPSRTKGPSKFNTVIVNFKQRGNPLLKYITNVPWEYSEIIPDYVMGKTSCALFLSIRYHQLNPDYIHERLKSLGSMYNLRVLLVQVDVADPHHALKHLTRVCILADLTLMLAWNAEDAGRIIETYKIYENKPPDAIMERSDSAPYQKLVNALTSIRSVNKTDATTLLSTFGTLSNLIKTQPNTLALCPGIGLQKAERIHKVLHEPFLRSSK